MPLKDLLTVHSKYNILLSCFHVVNQIFPLLIAVAALLKQILNNIFFSFSARVAAF